MAAGWLDLCASELWLWVEIGDVATTLPIQTVFLGGGTPSLLSPAAVEKFLSGLRTRFAFAQNVEITLETQPGTVDAQQLRDFANVGVNRFSIGVQTFDDTILQSTGRRHTVAQSRDTIVSARETGKTVSIDMICAWPMQSLAQWRADLDHAVSFAPDHISVYELTFHEGTKLYRDRKHGDVSEADEDLRIAMFEHTRDALTAYGFEQYEISNYARAGARSVHNQNYWLLGNYIGLGAGAHSMLFPDRYNNPNSATDYARAIQSGKLSRQLCNAADPDVFFAENLFAALRFTEGADIEHLASKLGRDAYQARTARLAELQAAELLAVSNGRVKLTPAGQLQADAIISHLL